MAAKHVALVVAAIAVAGGCRRKSRDAPKVTTAKLTFEIRDTAGKLIPGRITLVGVGDTHELKLSSTEVGDRLGSTLIAGNKIMTVEGAGQVDIPVGVYDLYASRGLEWTMQVAQKVAIGASGYAFRARLDHVIDTTGWLSGDFHVHAERSWDSYVPMTNRVIEFISEGVDLIVSTDHNIVADYGPAIAELDAQSYLASMISDEITTRSWGHFGVYPLPSSMAGDHYGSQWRTDAEGRTIFAGIRREHPGSIIQVNHPRQYDRLGYFSDERFDRSTGQARHPGFSFDFDAVEVLNGRGVSSTEQVLLDWFSLLDHGHIVTAMGNSDTHELHTTIGGYPRNFVRVPDDRPGKVSDADIIAAVRAHRSFFTTGPMLDLTSGAAGIGDVVKAPDGKVTISIDVSAAPWVDVTSATLYINGQLEKRWPITRTKLPQRLEAQYTFNVTRDSYVVLRADGSEPIWPIAGDAELTRVLPLAITNPLFIDRDGDGRYTR